MRMTRNLIFDVSACCVNEKNNFFFAKKTKAKKHKSRLFSFLSFFFSNRSFLRFFASNNQTLFPLSEKKFSCHSWGSSER